MGLAFWKLNYTAIHEQGEWHNHFQLVLGLRDWRDLLVTEFSLFKWHRCLR